MFRLNFTIGVLGYNGTLSLSERRTCQTIRNSASEIIAGLTSGLVKIGDMVEVVLNEKELGKVVISDWDKTSEGNLIPDDVIRGGFATMRELREALFRAGYKTGEDLWRVRFQWDIDAKTDIGGESHG